MNKLSKSIFKLLVEEIYEKPLNDFPIFVDDEFQEIYNQLKMYKEKIKTTLKTKISDNEIENILEEYSMIYENLYTVYRYYDYSKSLTTGIGIGLMIQKNSTENFTQEIIKIIEDNLESEKL